MEQVRKRAEFRQVVERLREACRAQGLDLAPAAAADILADLVQNMVSSLGLREETVVRTHLGTIDVAALATDLVRADEAQKREVAEASPAVISLEGAGRLVASFAQAIRCVSLNHEQLTRGDSDKWGAIGVLVQIERPRPAEPAWSTLPHFPRRGGR